MGEFVRLEVEDGVATIRVDRTIKMFNKEAH